MPTHRHGLLAAVLGLGLGWSFAATAQDAAPAGSLEAGQAIYATVGCWSCHGYSGQGGVGPAIAGGEMLPYDGFLFQLRHPSNVMPPYEEPLIPDQGVADIYAYLASLPKLPTAEEIPELKAYLQN